MVVCSREKKKESIRFDNMLLLFFKFAGFFPYEEAQYNSFEQSIERLALNDTGVRIVPTSNPGR